MKALNTLALMAALACLTVPLSATAQIQSGQRTMKLDANKDGQLSRDEVKGHARLEKAFDQIDANGDGALSRDELKAARGKMKDHRGAKPASSPR
jgi:hypothetical protein